MKKRYMALALACAAVMGVAFAGCGSGEDADTECTHESHDPTTLVCDECGETVDHYYVDGQCTRCFATTEFVWQSITLDETVIAGSDNGGSIEKITYSTRAYNLEALGRSEEGTLIEKDAFVYLPYGYTEEKQYNVLILLHGTGDTEGYWLCQSDRVTSYVKDSGKYTLSSPGTNDAGNVTVEVLDYMMAEGLSEEAIVVTPTFYDDVDSGETGNSSYDENEVVMRLYGAEVINYLLPAVIGTYSTYAESGESEDIIAARDHFAFAGLSRGSRTTFDSIIRDYLPYFSYYGNYSSPSDDNEGLVEALESEEFADYDIGYLFSAVGENDTSRISDLQTTYSEMLSTGKITEENSANILTYDTGHTYDCWVTCLYNSMLKFFR